MQRYSKKIGVLLLLGMLFFGCSAKKAVPSATQGQLNALLFEASYLESSGYFSQAAKLYEKLFKISREKEFFYKDIENLFHAKKYRVAMQKLAQAMKSYPNDWRLYHWAGTIEATLKHYDEAILYLNKAIELGSNAKDMELLASIYLVKKEYERALKYYKSAYAIKPQSDIINNIAYIMYFYLNRPKEAIAYLETHIRMYGCDKSTCHTLASLYGLQNNIDGLISVYQRLYESYKEEIYAKKLVELYSYQKDFSRAIAYAKKLEDKRYLLDLYKMTKQFQKAQKLAMELYRQTHDLNFLAQNAIFEYEGAKRKSRKLLQDVAAKLEKVIKKVDDPIYLNYLGYLYIEHDIDIKRGVTLVKKALKHDPNSPFYLDSLAWGYYKLRKCEEAWKLIKRVYYDLKLTDPEIQYHLRKIKACRQRK